ncbi:hypothetical protein PMKS-003697 [Pichia membranifaciens]|uniref:Altered inheritance of mitochondria protein 21 n=1 Tax=Pichia membranifaciens TaxID=4926 RepID=A0A1Q2YKW6_9ASCO|nr:hypothetical protein PMKS-003697 [Pichia membranifaciens]
MDVPQIPKSRPHKHQSPAPESNPLSEPHTDSIPICCPQKAETELPRVPQLPKSRPRRIQTSDSGSEVHSSDSQSAVDVVAPTIPKHRPSSANTTSVLESGSMNATATFPTGLSEENTLPHIPPTRPKQAVPLNHSEEEPKVEVDNIRREDEAPVKENEQKEKKEAEPEVIPSEVSNFKQNPVDKEENGLPDKGDKEEEEEEEEEDKEQETKEVDKEDTGEVLKAVEANDSDVTRDEEQQKVGNREEIDENVKSEISDKDEEPFEEKKPDAISELEALEYDTKQLVANTYNEESLAAEEQTTSRVSKIDQPVVDKDLPDYENDISFATDQTSEPRKISSTSAKNALAELDSLEQEIQLTSEKLSSTPTDPVDVENIRYDGEVKHVQAIDGENITNAKEKELEKEDPDETKEEKVRNELEKEANKEADKETEKEADKPVLPILPKSRPKPKVDSAHTPPKVPAKRPSVASSESGSSNNSDSTTAQIAHKKPPPRVPKKPSSRIAQFQEMLEQQQKADLGLLNRAAPKPKPKVPVKSHTFEGENSDEIKEAGDEGSPAYGESTTNSEVPKAERANFKFAQSLNGMIGMGLPGMAFGGNPFAAMKAAKGVGSSESTVAEEERGTEKSKVKDVRRGRARGPRGRKLPGAVTKAVEVNDTTLGNKFTIVVRDLWSLDFAAKTEPVEERVPETGAKELHSSPETSAEHIIDFSDEAKNEEVAQESDDKVGTELNAKIRSETDAESEDVSENSTSIDEHKVDVETQDRGSGSVQVVPASDSLLVTEHKSEPLAALQKNAPEEKEDDEEEEDTMPPTTFSFDNDEPSAAATATTSIGSILSPAGSSLEEDAGEEAISSDLSDQ